MPPAESAVLEHGLVSAPEAEVDAVRGLERQLEAQLDRDSLNRLVAPDGTVIEIPPSVYDVLARVVHHMARGDAISLVPYHQTLTTQQAAELLNMSRPSLVKLLDEGKIPFTREGPGKHRRVLLRDVLDYRARRSTERRASLDRMAEMSQELGIY